MLRFRVGAFAHKPLRSFRCDRPGDSGFFCNFEDTQLTRLWSQSDRGISLAKSAVAGSASQYDQRRPGQVFALLAGV